MWPGLLSKQKLNTPPRQGQLCNLQGPLSKRQETTFSRYFRISLSWLPRAWNTPHPPPLAWGPAPIGAQSTARQVGSRPSLPGTSLRHKDYAFQDLAQEPS